MKIFLNCSNLISGGGLTVGLGILHSLYQLNTDDKFLVFIPDTRDYSNFKDNDKIELLREGSVRTFSKLFLEWKLAKLAKTNRCEAILSLSNYALPIKLPQSLMLHWPYAVYPENEIWQRMSFINKVRRKLRLFKLRYLLPYSDTLIVQTEIMKMRAQSYLVPKKKIVVVPSSVGFLGDEENKIVSQKIQEFKLSGNKVFLCINEYYEHKNLEILIPLAKKIKDNSLNFRFVITISNNEFLEKIKGLEDVILNVGRVSRYETMQLFKSCDALFFPSLIESFGIPLVEAQQAGIPIYTSDRDFAHAVCGENAVYFNPLDVNDILEKISQEPFNQSANVRVSDWKIITLEMLKTLK